MGNLPLNCPLARSFSLSPSLPPSIPLSARSFKNYNSVSPDYLALRKLQATLFFRGSNLRDEWITTPARERGTARESRGLSRN